MLHEQEDSYIETEQLADIWMPHSDQKRFSIRNILSANKPKSTYLSQAFEHDFGFHPFETSQEPKSSKLSKNNSFQNLRPDNLITVNLQDEADLHRASMARAFERLNRPEDSLNFISPRASKDYVRHDISAEIANLG